MPTNLDYLYLVSIAVIWPLYEYFVDWPEIQRLFGEQRRSARTRMYKRSITTQWALVACGIALWEVKDRSWYPLRLGLPDSWRLWLAILLIVLLAALQGMQALKVLRSPELRGHVREMLIKSDLADLLPHTKHEFNMFIAASLTAGVCEEFLFRGFFIVILAPQLGWWPSAALGLVIFGVLHAYQGRAGIVRTALVGALMTFVLVATQSLVTAMALHALLDGGSGLVTWIALRESPTAPVAIDTRASAG
ncbi:MAG: CPBP family intramembrane glutamic endopeptidase [Gemmatimonadaceae bacterium]